MKRWPLGKDKFELSEVLMSAAAGLRQRNGNHEQSFVTA